MFAGQVRPGAVEIDVTVLRRGRSISQMRVAVRNPGAAAGYEALAVFGAERDGFSFTDAVVPDGVQPPHECPSFRDPPPPGVERRAPFDFWLNVEGRPTLGHAPWEEYEPESSLRGYWYRFDDPPRADDGAWDPYALVALCDTMPGAVAERVGPRRRSPMVAAQRRLHGPPLRRGPGRVGARGQPGPARGRGLRLGRHGDLGRGRSRAPRLVAYATQTMVFSFPK